MILIYHHVRLPEKSPPLGIPPPPEKTPGIFFSTQDPVTTKRRSGHKVTRLAIMRKYLGTRILPGPLQLAHRNGTQYPGP